MKISKLKMALSIIAISITSQQLLSQSCVSCFNDKSNVTIGYNNNVSDSWTHQSILGNNNTTSRNNAVAIGTNSTASWSHSYVFGSSSSSNGIHSYAIGSNSVAQSTSSFAVGNFALSMFGNALAVGNFTRSDAVGAYVFGLGISSAVPLANNIENSLVIGFKSTRPTLFVSESPFSTSNDRTGRIGIGNVTSPQAKLHIRADAGEAATLRLEATGSTGDNIFSRILFTNNHTIQAANNQNFTFTTQNNNHFIFHNGNIGVGIHSPAERLDVNGNVRISGSANTLLFDGAQSGKIVFNSGSGNIGTAEQRHSLNFFTGEGNIRMTIDGESGNVGIGVSPPTSRLHVAGAVHATGNLIINNTTTITSGRIGYFANGNASAPAYSFSGNQNTGMFQPAAGILAFSTGGTEKVRIASNGDVGIGTNSPASTLHIQRSSGSSQVFVVESVTGNSGILLKSDAQNKGFFWWDNGSQYLAVGPGNNNNSLIFKSNNIGVGCTPSSSYKLDIAGAARLNGSLYVTDNNNVYVNGEIHAKKFRATYNPWPDYVFNPDYELPGLCEIEHFITTNRHLPGIPSAAQVEKEGFELAEMNGLLLKKIEELTLYLIEQQKEINTLKVKISQIEIEIQ